MDTKLYGNACGRAGALWDPLGEVPTPGGLGGLPEAGDPAGRAREPSAPGPDRGGPRLSGPWSEAGRLRRYQQLRHAEERLRPLRETRLAHVYWKVHDEMRRLGREIRRDLEE